MASRRITKCCKVCGSEFTKPLSQSGEFCSRKCMYTYRSMKPSTLASRMLKWVDSSGGEDSCHEWTGTLYKTGYGAIAEKGKHLRTNRVAYELSHSVCLRSDQHVLHTCDNRKCCNPKHLFLGTPKINSDDKIAKGRDKNRGEESHLCRLTSADVSAIRMLRTAGHTGRYLAKLFNVSEGHVSMICSGKNRRHDG